MNSIKPSKKIKGNRNFCLNPIVVAVACCFALNAAQANPIGAQVVNGTAAISQSGNTLNITNSPNAIINWQGFSINTGEATRFIQQSASSAILNRVVGTDPSQLLGTLTSNGKVFLINPAGILVGQGARIDVAGLVASTLNFSNEDFLAGKFNFGLTPNAGTIQNNGAITTPEGGTVYLVAPQIKNQGIITTPRGETILVAGNTVQLMDTGTPGVTVQVTGSDNNATNLGQILADSGRIGMVAATLKNSGTLNASSLVSEGGRIFLRASQDAYVDKDARIAATGSKGGSIEVLGSRVAVMDNAQLDASGQNGGGSVLVGGDYQGKNPAIQNSQITYFGSNAGIKADAIANGDGGKVIIWANDTTRAYGNISARGGAQGGNGGFVEASGHNYLDFQGRVDTLAPQGSNGTLLLDPADIIIDNSANAWNGTFGGGVFSSAAGTPAYLTWATINGQSGAVQIQTSPGVGAASLGDIDINATGAVTGPTTLTLLANGNVTIANAVSVGGGSANINLIAGWNNTGTATNSGTGTITFSPNSSLSTTGNVLLSAGNAVSQDPSATITANTLSIIGSQGGTRLPGGASLPGANMVNTLAADIAGGGSLTFSNNQALTIGTAGGFSGILAGGNTNPINITTTVGNLIISQPIVSDVLGGSPINLTAANTLTLNAAVTSTFNATPAGPVVLQAGAGGVTSNASGVIWAGGLKVVSGGGVTLNAANKIDVLAGTSAAGFQFTDTDGFMVDTVQATNGLLASTGDITLKAGAASSLLNINKVVTATTGSVSYIADEMTLTAMTTATTAGKYVEVKPSIPATNINLGGADAANTLGLTAAELGQITTNTLRVGDASAGNINLTAPTGGFSTLSLVSNGTVGQATAADIITATNLAVRANGNVSLATAPNVVTNLAAQVTGGGATSFSFKNAGALNVSNNIDLLSGISAPGMVALTSGGALTQSAGALLGGTSVYAEGSRVILTNANGPGVIAGKATGNAAGDIFSYTSINGIQVTTVNGFAGIQTGTPADAVSVVLNAGNAGIGQSQLINAGAGTKNLSLTTTGPVNLVNTGNNVLGLMAVGVGGLTFYNSGGLSVMGNGVTTSANQPISITANGNILGVNAPVTAGVGSLGTVSLTGVGVVNSNTITGPGGVTIKAGTGTLSNAAGTITNGGASTGSISLIADSMTLAGGTIASSTNGGAASNAGTVALSASTVGRNVNLGSTVGGTLSLLGPDLQTIAAANGLVIGGWATPGTNTISTSGTGGVTVNGVILSTDLPGIGSGGVWGFELFNMSGPIAVNAALTSPVKLTLATSGAVNVAAPLASTTGSLGINGASVTHSVGNISGTGVTIFADTLSLVGGTVTAGASGAHLSTFTASRPINLGSALGGTLSILGIDLQTITSSGGLQIGGPSFNTGGITVAGPIAAGDLIGVIGPLSLMSFTGPIAVNAALTSPVPLILSTGGAIAVNNAQISSSGNITLTTLTTGGITLNAATADAYIMGSPDVYLILGGNFAFTASGGYKAYVSSALPATTHLTFTNSTGMVLFNGSQADATTSGNMGFFYGGAPGGTGIPAVVGSNLVLVAGDASNFVVVAPPLTIDQCIADPNISGCSGLLPSLASCTTTPTLAGCSGVLPTLASCTTTPTLAGCSGVLPTLASCTTTPTLAGCSAVLPTLASCTTTPTLAGCSATLPTLASCTTTPTLAGCSAVLPTLASCTTTPTLAGCSAILPTLASCTTTPTLAGCTAVLPSLATCTTAPATTGCTAVLPSLAACTVTPTLPGCSVVLPTLASCITTPTLAGCSAILPTLASCTTTPTLAGCAVVLPSLAACTVTPTLPGCSVVLPTLASCTTTPTLSGCTVVLPSLVQCTATPTLAGCSAVLPPLASCTTTPTLAGCATVLPSLATCTANPATAGCAAVLPSLATCTTASATAGCTAVLPSLAQCTATPTLSGCSVVLPSLVSCATTPTLTGCAAVLPSLATCTANPATAGCVAVLPAPDAQDTAQVVLQQATVLPTPTIPESTITTTTTAAPSTAPAAVIANTAGVTGGNAFTTFGPAGGTVGGTAGSFGGADAVAPSGSASVESGKGGDKANGNNGSAKKDDIDKKEKDKKDKKDDTDKKDDGNAKDDKNKGKPNEKPEKC